MQVDVDGKTEKGPEVSEKADADPREFIVDVSEGEVNIKLTYVACDDEETWCKNVTQEFKVTQERDPDAGRVSGMMGRGRGGRGGMGRGGRGGMGRGGGRGGRPGGNRPGGQRRPAGE